MPMEKEEYIKKEQSIIKNAHEGLHEGVWEESDYWFGYQPDILTSQELAEILRNRANYCDDRCVELHKSLENEKLTAIEKSQLEAKYNYFKKLSTLFSNLWGNL